LRIVQFQLFHLAFHRLDAFLDLRLDGFEIEARAALHWRVFDERLAYSPTFCCRKTNRQNSCS
jgi:hypothetical protein